MKIYLASPYSAKCDNIMEQRFHAACDAAGELIIAGHIVYCSIAHCHPIAERCFLPRDAEYWSRHNKAFIAWADEVWVKTLAGWQESKGVSEEIEYAEAIGKTVIFF
ncbi:MAG: DUF1937 family protein [Anaerovoracaceae bacterium]